MAKINSYPKCSTIRLRGVFVDGNGDPTDPTAIVCQVITPAGVQTDYQYGEAGSGIVRVTTGDYYRDVECTTAGTWQYRWRSTGGLAADENEFIILESGFTEPG
jgi:hypothetical protein